MDEVINKGGRPKGKRTGELQRLRNLVMAIIAAPYEDANAFRDAVLHELGQHLYWEAGGPKGLRRYNKAIERRVDAAMGFLNQFVDPSKHREWVPIVAKLFCNPETYLYRSEVIKDGRRKK